MYVEVLPVLLRSIINLLASTHRPNPIQPRVCVTVRKEIHIPNYKSEQIQLPAVTFKNILLDDVVTTILSIEDMNRNVKRYVQFTWSVKI